jgi:phage regulator Rha-like protein
MVTHLQLAAVHVVAPPAGFSLLAMGLAGVKALAFRLANLDAFYAMEAFVRNKREGIGFRQARHELRTKG